MKPEAPAETSDAGAVTLETMAVPATAAARFRQYAADLVVAAAADDALPQDIVRRADAIEHRLLVMFTDEARPYLNRALAAEAALARSPAVVPGVPALDWHEPTDADRSGLPMFVHGGLAFWYDNAWHSLMLTGGETRSRPIQWDVTEVAHVPGLDMARGRGRHSVDAALASSQADAGGGDPLADLVTSFSAALLDKLRAAEVKYGHDDAWMRDDWRDSLCRQIAEHVVKGDPRDVAAYAAFAWHHGWSVSSAAPAGGVPGVEAIAEALKPFAAVANHDIGESETDLDYFHSAVRHNKAPRLTVGDLRCAAALHARLTAAGMGATPPTAPAQPLAADVMREAAQAIVEEAIFLVERLADLGDDVFSEDGFQEFNGHVTPSMSRLGSLLRKHAADLATPSSDRGGATDGWRPSLAAEAVPVITVSEAKNVYAYAVNDYYRWDEDHTDKARAHEIGLRAIVERVQVNSAHSPAPPATSEG